MAFLRSSGKPKRTGMGFVFQIGVRIENNTKSRLSSLEVQERHKSLQSTNRASSELYSALGPPFGSSCGFHHLEGPLPQAVGPVAPWPSWLDCSLPEQFSIFSCRRSAKSRAKQHANWAQPITWQSPQQAKYTPTWLDDLTQIPNLKPQILRLPLIFGFV